VSNADAIYNPGLLKYACAKIIAAGERSGLLTRTATERFVARADEKLTAFIELQSAIRRRNSNSLHVTTSPPWKGYLHPKRMAQRSSVSPGQHRKIRFPGIHK